MHNTQLLGPNLIFRLGVIFTFTTQLRPKPRQQNNCTAGMDKDILERGALL